MLEDRRERPTFTRKERSHIEAIEARVAYLIERRGPERHEEPDYISGETQALHWVLQILRQETEPTEIRLKRLENQLRLFGHRIARIEQEIADDEV